MGFCRIPFGGRGRFVLPASHVCCSFTSKTFQGKPLPAKQDVRLRRDFKSSAVAVVHACRICNMASIAGVRPVFDGAARCQPSGFFSIVESERLWQVKPLPLPTTSSTTCRAWPVCRMLLRVRDWKTLLIFRLLTLMPFFCRPVGRNRQLPVVARCKKSNGRRSRTFPGRRGNLVRVCGRYV